MRTTKGFTIVEAMVAWVLAMIVLGILWAVWSPTQRQGAEVEARLSTIRAVMILSARLEQDVQQARAIAVEDGALVIRAGGQSVRYAHEPGAAVRRTKSNAAGDASAPVGACRFARVSFDELSGERGAVRVTILPQVSRRGRIAEEPATFVVRTPVTESTSWRSATAAD